MNNQDWERFGEDIRQTIQDAVEYGNYDRLNQTIQNTVNQATDWVARNIKNANVQNGTYRKAAYQEPVYNRTVVKRPKTELFEVNSSSKVAGILFTVFGYTFGGILAVWTLILLLGALILGEFASLIGVLITGILLVGGFGIMAYKGTKRLTSISRFKKYVKEIGAAEFCNITDLAARVQKSVGFVVKDLENMIRKGWFKEGHLDRKKTCLIVTNEMYDQYHLLEVQKDEQLKAEEEKRKVQQEMEQKQADSRKALSPEVQKVIAQGDAYVKKIRECNDRIPGEEISAKIYKMEMVVDKIFDRVEQNPSSVSDIRKLMDYYLPTTIKLLDAYAEMDAQPVDGENIQTAKKEIEATLDTLNVAFEKLLDSLFMHAAWDVSSDISVLNTMLAQEGLKDDGMKK